MRIFATCTLYKYFYGGLLKEDDMVGKCGTGIGEQKCIQNFGGENWRRDHFEDLDVDIDDKIKIDLKAVRWDGVGWIQVAEDRDKGRTIVNGVMSLKFT